MKFTIAVPAYKALYLQECIESILSQTYKDFELVIVNDASPNDLTSIVKSYTDKRIRYYINEKNCGSLNVVDNWNICLSYAKGDYIICMGDDDKMLPICLEKYIELIDKYPGLGVYHAWTQIIDKNSEVISIQEARPEYEGVCCLMWERLERQRQQFIGDFCFDTNLLRKDNGFYKLPLAWGSDDISVFRAAMKNGIANTQIPTFQYRVNLQTISKTGNVEIKMEALFKASEWYKNFLCTFKPNNNGIENIFYGKIKNRYDLIMMHKKLDTIIKDLMINFTLTRFFFWYMKRKKYDYNMKLLVYAIIEALKSRVAGTVKNNIYL